MGSFVRGEVVIAKFPFADLTGFKLRPVLVIAEVSKNRVIVCQITSQAVSDALAIRLLDDGFTKGNLQRASFLRPNYLFTADVSIIASRVGNLKDTKLQEVVEQIIQIVSTK